MSGRRRTGAAAAAGVNVLSNALALQTERAFNAQEEDRKFRQRLVELGIKGEVPGIEANPSAVQSLLTGQPFQGTLLQRADPQAQVATFQSQLGGLLGGDEGELTIKRTIPGLGEVTFKRGGEKANAPKTTEAEIGRIGLATQLSPAGAGLPPQLGLAPQPLEVGQRTFLAGGRPTTPGGFESANQLIASGQLLGPAEDIASIPNPPTLLNRLGGFARSVALPLVAPLTRPAGSPGRPQGGRAVRSGSNPPPDLPDPQDPSLSEDGVSTEGAQWQASDRSIWEVQDGQWVRVQ